MSNFPMEVSNCSCEHQKYARPKTHRSTLVSSSWVLSKHLNSILNCVSISRIILDDLIILMRNAELHSTSIIADCISTTMLYIASFIWRIATRNANSTRSLDGSLNDKQIQNETQTSFCAFFTISWVSDAFVLLFMAETGISEQLFLLLLYLKCVNHAIIKMMKFK